MKIKILDPQVVARIAAGEVIERPASVVKELVENSLDAGSTRITVETSGGGAVLIRITDDGSGISSSELELAFQRYATSKISDLSDLESISSLGFRGEALPSIAAVSDIEVATWSPSDPSGSYIRLHESTPLETRGQARDVGTTITVKNLLRNVPARLKFLKSNPTENGHIADVVTHYALAYPEVKFTLICEGRTVMRTPGTGRLADAVSEIYGLETGREMLELNENNDGWPASAENRLVGVSGMVSPPAINRANRDTLTFFVNRRWINSKLLSWAVEEAYHGLLMTGRHPVAVINISVPPREVDVNIHPTKSEVKFQNERLVFGAVQKAVRRALVAGSPVPGIAEAGASFEAPSQPVQTFWSVPASETPRNALYPANYAEAHAGPTNAPAGAITPSMSLPALRLLGQIASSYIVAEGPDGVYLIDQHAAHERILFEQIRRQSSQKGVEVQGLLEPATLEVTPRQDARLKSRYADLSEFGFTIEPFGERGYLVRAVPLLLHKKDWAAALRELLDRLEGGGSSDWREEMMISFACHGAIKAGQPLSDDEMREMLRLLEKAALPNSCPHGRPTMIRLTTSQLEREFHRT